MNQTRFYTIEENNNKSSRFLSNIPPPGKENFISKTEVSNFESYKRGDPNFTNPSERGMDSQRSPRMDSPEVPIEYNYSVEPFRMRAQMTSPISYKVFFF